MKKYKGIRYSFRPKSYWAEPDPLTAILRNVTGGNPRRMIPHSTFFKSTMTEPKPLGDFKDQLLASREIQELIDGEYGPSAGEALARFQSGDLDDLPDLIEVNK